MLVNMVGVSTNHEFATQAPHIVLHAASSLLQNNCDVRITFVIKTSRPEERSHSHGLRRRRDSMHKKHKKCSSKMHAQPRGAPFKKPLLGRARNSAAMQDGCDPRTWYTQRIVMPTHSAIITKCNFLLFNRLGVETNRLQRFYTVVKHKPSRRPDQQLGLRNDTGCAAPSIRKEVYLLCGPTCQYKTRMS